MATILWLVLSVPVFFEFYYVGMIPYLASWLLALVIHGAYLWWVWKQVEARAAAAVAKLG